MGETVAQSHAVAGRLVEFAVAALLATVALLVIQQGLLPAVTTVFADWYAATVVDVFTFLPEPAPAETMYYGPR